MKLAYLTWVKNLERDLYNNSDYYQLLSSAVEEPTELFHRHLKQNYDKIIIPRLNEPNSWGHPSTIDHLSFKYGISTRNILLTYGTSNAIYLVCRALLHKDDQVIIETPTYEPLIAAAEFVGAKVVFVRRVTPDYKIDPDAIEKAINSKTRLIMLTNLHNPSGAFIKDEELLTISEIARKHGDQIQIVVDEIYHDFVIGIQPSAASLANNIIAISSLTKVYGLALIRCGWVFAAPDIINTIRQVYMMTEGNGSRLLEVISSVIIENLNEYIELSHQLVARNREILRDTIEPLLKEGILSSNIPEHGCIYFPEVSGLKDTSDFAQQLADRFKVLIVPGRFFDESNHIRIGFGGNSERLKTSLERFVEGAFKLRRQ